VVTVATVVILPEEQKEATAFVDLYDEPGGLHRP
jgi:hypothetical protein